MIARSPLHQEHYDQYVDTCTVITNVSSTITGIYTVLLVITGLKQYHILAVTFLVKTNMFNYNMLFAILITNFILSFCFLMGLNLYYQLKFKLTQREVYLLTFYQLFLLFCFSIIIVFLYLLYANGIFYGWLFKLFH